MWNNVIGIENEQKGTNSAIEAALHAPSYGGGHKAQRMERAQALIEQGRQLGDRVWTGAAQGMGRYEGHASTGLSCACRAVAVSRSLEPAVPAARTPGGLRTYMLQSSYSLLIPLLLCAPCSWLPA